MDSRWLSLGIILDVSQQIFSVDTHPPFPFNFILNVQLPIEDKHLILEWKRKLAIQHSVDSVLCEKYLKP